MYVHHSTGTPIVPLPLFRKSNNNNNNNNNNTMRQRSPSINKGCHVKPDYTTTVIIISIIIETSRTGPSGKNKVVYKLLLQPHKHLHHRKLKKTHPGIQPTVDCTLEPIQHSGVKHSIGKVIPDLNLRR